MEGKKAYDIIRKQSRFQIECEAGQEVIQDSLSLSFEKVTFSYEEDCNLEEELKDFSGNFLAGRTEAIILDESS